MRGLSDGEGVLEDDLHSPPQLAQVAAAGRASTSRAAKRTRAGGRLDQPQHAAAERALAAAALADQRQRLAGRERQADTVHGADVAEVLDEVFDLQQRSHVVPSPARPQRTQCPGSSSRSSCGRRHASAPVGSGGRSGNPAGARRVGHGAVDGGQAPPAVEARHGGQQRPRVRVQRPAEQRRHPGRLHHLTRVHHRHPVGISSTTPRSCVMSRIAMPPLRAQAQQQVEDLGLDGHVQRRRRLVGDQQRRLGSERHRRSSPAASCRR